MSELMELLFVLFVAGTVWICNYQEQVIHDQSLQKYGMIALVSFKNLTGKCRLSKSLRDRKKPFLTDVLNN